MKPVAATLAALLLAGSAYAAAPTTKKPRVKPAYQVTVKVVSRADFQARTKGEPVPFVITAGDEDSCTVWVPLRQDKREDLAAELAAYRGCYEAIHAANGVR